MKRLIISEGSHDNLFISTLFKSKLHKNESIIKRFDQYNHDKMAELKHKQQVCLSSFYESTSPYEILIKTEAGKNKIAPVIQSELSYLCELKLDPIIMIDLDNYNEPDEFVYNIKTRIETKFRNLNINISINLKEAENQNAIMSSLKLYKDNNFLSTMYVISIKTSLETLINGLDGSDITKQQELVSNFLKNDTTMYPLFTRAMNNL